MSRGDRRSSRNRDWNQRENSEYSNRSERKRNRTDFKNDRNEKSGRNEKNERRFLDTKNGKRAEKHSEQRKSAYCEVNSKEIAENENAIKKFKSNVPICELCGQPITDISSAISNRDDGKPAHFDCVLNKIAETEKIGPNEKIAYIGQGRFGVIYYENPRDAKHFSIRKIIEWEGRDQERGEWRNEMAGLYSQVK